MYGSLRFRDLKLGIHVPFSPCSRNPLHSFIPVVSVNLQDEKKKIWIKKKKNSSQVCDTLTLLKSSWLSSCQNWSSKFKIKNIDHRREASSCSESLQTLIYKLVIPNLICTLGQLECLCIDWALIFKM